MKAYACKHESKAYVKAKHTSKQKPYFCRPNVHLHENGSFPSYFVIFENFYMSLFGCFLFGGPPVFLKKSFLGTVLNDTNTKKKMGFLQN